MSVYSDITGLPPFGGDSPFAIDDKKYGGDRWHLHTCMSIQSTVFWTDPVKSGELAARAKELGMDSMAITDHGVMYGGDRFLPGSPCGRGSKPIIGCEVYVSPGSRFDRETVHGEDRYYHLVLLAGKQYRIPEPDEDRLQGLCGRPSTINRGSMRRSCGSTTRESSPLSACLAGVKSRDTWKKGLYEDAEGGCKTPPGDLR